MFPKLPLAMGCLQFAKLHQICRKFDPKKTRLFLGHFRFCTFPESSKPRFPEENEVTDSGKLSEFFAKFSNFKIVKCEKFLWLFSTNLSKNFVQICDFLVKNWPKVCQNSLQISRTERGTSLQEVQRSKTPNFWCFLVKNCKFCTSEGPSPKYLWRRVLQGSDFSRKEKNHSQGNELVVS